MRKLESLFGTSFRKWFLHPDNRFADQIVFEYKVTTTNTYNLNTWRKKQGHQEVNLKKMSGDTGIFHTFTDLDPRGTPADAFFISNSPAYLVVWFDRYKHFFLIPVQQIPNQTSISYDYCCEHFTANELLKKVKKVIEI